MKLGTEEKPKKAKASKGIDMLDLMDEAAARYVGLTDRFALL